MRVLHADGPEHGSRACGHYMARSPEHEDLLVVRLQCPCTLARIFCISLPRGRSRLRALHL